MACHVIIGWVGIVAAAAYANGAASAFTIDDMPILYSAPAAHDGSGRRTDCSQDADCNDALVCTFDICGVDHQCTHEVKPTFCLIDGACHKDARENPLNKCQYCDISQDQTSWTAGPAGTPCGDPIETACTFADSCSTTGECLRNDVADGRPCPDDRFCNGEEVCDGGSCAAGEPPCDWPGLSCDETYETCICRPEVNCAILHVDQAAPGPTPDGLNWSTAYRDLQCALDHAAGALGAVTRIRLAQGVYRPSRPIDPDDPRTASFRLVGGTWLKGGYAGSAAEDPDMRNVRLFETILTGDLEGDDDEDANAGRTDNAYQVVTGIACGDKTIIEGFTITGGQADGPGPFNTGGAMYNLECGPLVVDCTFHHNWAVLGGAVFNIENSDTTLIRCTFHDNTAGFQGGALWNGESQPLVINSVFRANTAINGGALSNNVSSPVLIHCTLADNVATDDGGGMKNIAGTATLSGCILWYNADRTGSGSFAQIQGSATVAFSNVQGGWSGSGNIDADPLFADGELRLGPGSPCIDAADNTALPGDIVLDRDGRGRFLDDPHTPDAGIGTSPIVDMGAFEFQPPEEVYTGLDIMPGTCPNAVNPRKGRFVRMALMGTETFPIHLVDLESLSVARTDGAGESVSPQTAPGSNAPRIEDVATPFQGVRCGCHPPRGDGWDDLVVAVSAADLVDAVHANAAGPGSLVYLTLTGSLIDGTAFEASDCILLPLSDPPHPRSGLKRSADSR